MVGIAASGGLAAWSPKGSTTTDAERRLLLWLKTLLAEPLAAPLLYLGYGSDDRFARGHRLLADLLPRDPMVTAESNHDQGT